MSHKKIAAVLSQENLTKLFPKERANDFFEALFGDASEGAYDINLSFARATDQEITCHLNLTQRPGCCLVCNLTQGLPNVFSRHPVINIQGIVDGINTLLGDIADCGTWHLESTIGTSNELHIIPLTIKITSNN